MDSTSRVLSNRAVPTCFRSLLHSYVSFRGSFNNEELTVIAANGPRWLISKHRKNQAVEVLERLRDKEDVRAGRPQAEADAIEEALENKVEKGPWLDLFVSLATSVRSGTC